VENTRYARVFHSRQWSDYNLTHVINSRSIVFANAKLVFYSAYKNSFKVFFFDFENEYAFLPRDAL